MRIKVMAIKQQVIDARFGSTIPDAYIKFCYMRWSDVDKKCMATFSTWATPTAEAEGLECIETFEIDVTSVFPNIQEDMYKEIKKLTKFKDAIDVL